MGTANDKTFSLYLDGRYIGEAANIQFEPLSFEVNTPTDIKPLQQMNEMTIAFRPSIWQRIKAKIQRFFKKK